MIVNGRLLSVQFSPDGVNWTSLDHTIQAFDRVIDCASRHQVTPQGYVVSPRRAARRAHQRRMKHRAK